jgi:hypothetical protein
MTWTAFGESLPWELVGLNQPLTVLQRQHSSILLHHIAGYPKIKNPTAIQNKDLFVRLDFDLSMSFPILKVYPSWVLMMSVTQ